MSEYYGVQRSSSSLSHYGVKGMRWGVRKAIEQRNASKLSKQYRKALMKAKKLNTKANVKKSQQEYKGRMADAATLGITGGLAAGSGFGYRALARSMNSRVYGMYGLVPFDSETAPYAGAAVGGLAAGLGGYNLAKGIAAKRRTTKMGHLKAQTKADAWRSEMKKAFKGTKYAQLPGARGENKPYGYEPVKQQMGFAAKGAVTSPSYVMNKKAANSVNPAPKKKRKSNRG